MGEDGLKSEIFVQKVNNYYQLYLNQETQRYVFRILAAKIIMSNPEKFGYRLTKEDLYLPEQFDTVEIKALQPIPLHVIAQAADTYFKIIKDLNPQIKYYSLPAGTFQIHIPRGKADGFQKRYEKLMSAETALKNASVYTVRKGDTLYGISNRFQVPYKALTIWNSLDKSGKISPGDKLYIFKEHLNLEEGKTEKTDQETP